MRRYRYRIPSLKAAIENRTYGEPLMLHCAHRNPAVDESYDTPMAVENSMIHEIDVLRWLLNERLRNRRGCICQEHPQNPRKPYGPADHDPTTNVVSASTWRLLNTGHCYDIKCEVV